MSDFRILAVDGCSSAWFPLAFWRAFLDFVGVIDRAEIERCRRKWLISAVAFPVFWLIHPLVLASGLAVCCG